MCNIHLNTIIVLIFIKIIHKCCSYILKMVQCIGVNVGGVFFEYP